MKTLLKNAREAKGLTTRKVASLLKIHQALISKFENGQRTPTKAQLPQLCELLEIDIETLTIAWIKEKLKSEFGSDEIALKAMREYLEDVGAAQPEPDAIPASFQKLMDDMESLKAALSASGKIK